MTKPKKPRGKLPKADYGNATPEQVVKALHSYRPKRRSVTAKKVAEDPARVNPRL